MKLTAQTSLFKNAFQKTLGAVNPKNPRDVLKSVLLIARKDKSLLLATDLEMGIRTTVRDVKVEEEGQVLLPVERVGPLLQETVDEQFSLTAGPASCDISFTDSSFHILSMSVEEFPDVPEFNPDGAWSFPASELAAMVRKTAFATAKESPRPVLNGLLWAFRDNRLNVVGTDGHRMAWVKRQNKKGQARDIDLIIPNRTLAQIEKLISAASGDILLNVSNDQLIMAVGEVTIVARLIDGNFPQYEDVVPGHPTAQLEIERTAFLSAVRRAAILTTDLTNAIDIAFSQEGIKVSCSSSDAGDAEISVEGAYSGSPVEMSFSPVLLREVLQVADTEKVKMEITDRESAAVIRSGANFTYVVMPVVSSGE